MGLLAAGVISLIMSAPILISRASNRRKAKAFMMGENRGFNSRYLSVGLSIGI